MDLHDYLRILRQRWVFIALATLIAVGGALAWTLSTTPQYQSTARLFVQTPQSSEATLAQGGTFSQQRVKSYAKLLTGEEIARRVVEQLDLDEDPRALAERINATVELDTVVLVISVTDESPAHARELTQATAEAFTSYVSELETPPGKSSAPVKASIVDRATLPGAPVSPQPVRNVALALVLGLLVGVGLAVLRDTLDTRVKTPADLSEASGDAPALGHIFFDRNAAKQPLISNLQSHSPRVEAYRVLRTNLQFVNVDSTSRIFVVTSALPGEGKSTTTCNLAIALAEAGHRVLVIEADLRRPKAADYFGLEQTVGLTTVLVGRVPFADAVQHAAPGCDVLASGATPPNPAELLQTEAMRRLLADVRAEYDYVLIDAPPLLPVTDAALLASQSDGAILVVRHNSTTRDEVRDSVERLQSVGARLLGTIANMAPAAKRGGSRYGYGYGYGYAPDSTSRRKGHKESRQARKPGGTAVRASEPDFATEARAATSRTKAAEAAHTTQQSVEPHPADDVLARQAQDAEPQPLDASKDPLFPDYEAFTGRRDKDRR